MRRGIGDKVATLVKDLIAEVDNPFVKRQLLFKMEPPLEGQEFIIASAAIVPVSGPETYLFAADKDGEVKSFAQLEPSQRGTLDIERVLFEAGYNVEITGPDKTRMKVRLRRYRFNFGRET